MSYTDHWPRAPLAELGQEVRQSLRPQPGTQYELFSVPTFPTGQPEVLDGKDIGSTKRTVRPGDVLICKINPRINRVWTVPEPVSVGPQIASGEYLVFRPDNRILSRFLMWYLRSPAFRDWIKLSVEGATGSHTRAKSGPILRQLAPVPRLDEQRRVVAAIEEQFSRLDAANGYLRKASNSLEALRASLVREAIDETWPTGTIAEITSPTRASAYGVLQPGRHVHGGVRLIRVTDIVHGVVQTMNLKQIDPAISAKYPRTQLQGGEVLLTIVGTIGRTAVVPPNLAGSNVARAVAVIPVDETMNPNFVSLALSTRRSVAQLVGLAHEVARKTLNLEDVRRFRIPVPPRKTQDRVVASVAAEVSVTDGVVRDVQQARTKLMATRNAILRDAFAGRFATNADALAAVVKE